METKEECLEDERPSSPYEVLQHISGEAVRVASEAIQSVYNHNNNNNNNIGASNSGNVSPVVGKLGHHRRVRSESVSSSGNFRSNSFQKWKAQMQRALQRGGHKEEQYRKSSFNPEVLVNQKRQWYQHHSKQLDFLNYKEPTSIFEHFVIVGLPSDTNLKAVEDAFAKKKTWELQMAKCETFDTKTLQYRGPSYPMLEPQILFKYPPGKKLAMHPKDLPAFCFPEGVKAKLMERTPSMSDLNEVVHGQGADNATLYGVCLHVQEIVQRSPGIIGVASPFSRSPGGFSRFLVSAPRCYCVLTRVPFFELHYEMLNSIVTQERLNRITQFVSEMNITDYIPSPIGTQEDINENNDSPKREQSKDWTAFAVPVDSAAALTAAAAGIISDDEVHSYSFRVREPETPESICTSEASDISQAKETDKENRKGVQIFDDYSSETLETHSDDFGSYGNGHRSPESFGSSVMSMGSEDDEDDEVSSFSDKNAGNDAIMKWAKEHKNDLLQIVCCYHSLPLPPYGGETVFQPLEHLQAVKYSRPAVSTLGLYGIFPDIKLQGFSETAEGLLSAIVLSLVPLIRPFEWQSLLLPVLPKKMLDFLDAPVPFIVKICHLPTLPRHRELISELGPIHARLSCENSIAKRHPVYKCNEVQAEAAVQFLNVTRHYLESLCSDLRSHTITSVQSNNDKVSLLFKDSFIDSFPNKDRPFIKLLVDTQLFSALSDSRLSFYEHEQF
ncbi:hypothetical protein IFM89_023913 [Coptis chinensis]|uniref:UDENN domain-containing protein n=1 Tax=Coptis chinensis TaxID=261450 RepID=A0A835LZE8_9MAGN|nr:hypothetical protein IFM89_023913 [Coptis chinensis]